MSENLTSQTLHSALKNEVDAIAEIKEQITIINPEVIIFFCSALYNIDNLSKTLGTHFKCNTIGCTTAGEVTSKYHSHSIVALVLSSSSFAVHSELINELDQFDLPRAIDLALSIEKTLSFSSHFNKSNMFGFLLIDGLSLTAETIISRLSLAFSSIDIFGGSAGDDLLFEHPLVFFNNQAYKNSAVMTVIEVKDNFTLFKTQNYTPTDKELIITEVDFDNRLVKEINGRPAAEAYADLINIDVDALDIEHFAVNPLMINLMNEWYIRSPSSINDDKSMNFYCAIGNGLPLVIGQRKPMEKDLQLQLDAINDEFEEIHFTLGCDCIFRRTELLNNEGFGLVEAVLSKFKFIGFSSYGEQYAGVHFNQTLSAVVIGKKRHV